MALLLKLLLLSQTFNKFVADLDLFSCPKGQLIKMHGASQKYCAACPEGYHQPGENYSKQCKPCTKCNEVSGSEVTEKCTKETDTKCQCREGFVPVEPDSATCECSVGFGLRRGECSKCEDGSFNRRPDTPCIKWKACKSGVNISGNSTSDVICNGEPKRHPHGSPTSNRTVSVNTPPHERAQSHNSIHADATTTTTTTTTAVHKMLSRDKVEPAPLSTTTNFHIGLAFLIFGIVALLILSAVTCKVHVTTFVRRWSGVQRDLLYRRPVEESGDGTRSNLNSKKP
ncbi:tumor necrosis factor receptor superfamily member 21 isoform X1 [Phyllopteryx taeniolatus]|uniref:tumor necrosis factor receptor superfamily member 21 isoform X1 n=1 Tax=Phyllopteryx taeniolatus TaxID=161469 RepID=UPI002AD28C86|nr:tumor necrosis factor receptor superfamily member 21 isoform X1 [Phyllopteryx taeniolatus]